tara:strand:+ start:36 stop:593 length:558 start_codon:yes stop_codon:yes gene_type:complete
MLNKQTNNYVLPVLLALLFTLANVGLTLHRENTRLKGVAELANMRSDVNNDFVDELLWSVVNDFDGQTADMLIAQGRIEGVIDYINNDNATYIDNLWHTGYEHGLSQMDFEREVIATNSFNEGYEKGKKENLFASEQEKVNIPLRPVIKSAIKEPEFDSSSNLPENTEVVKELNKKIQELQNSED